MRLIIADDHILIRAGLRRLVETLPGIEVVGEATDGAEVLALLARAPAEILLLDISMPGMDGIRVLQEVKRRHPEVRVIMLSMHSDMQHVRSALSNGASGFLVKDSAPVELELALRTVAQGQLFLSPRVSAGVAEALIAQSGKRDPEDPLSPRQREILELIGQGYGTKEIATRLQLSTKTVETHRARMMETLGLKRGSELLRYALHQQAT